MMMVDAKRLFKWRVIIAGLGVFAFVSVLLFKLFILQVKDRALYETMADENRFRFVAVPPLRGLIYDRHREPLARNQTVYRLTVIPDMIEDMDSMLLKIKDFVSLDRQDIAAFNKELKSHKPFHNLILKDHLTAKEVANLAVNRHRFPGVDIGGSVGRYYPYNREFFHTVGYLGKLNNKELRSVDYKNYLSSSRIGKTGIENRYEKLLRGNTGFLQVEVNAEGRTLRSVGIEKPSPGRGIMLTIDKNLQQVAYDALGEMEGAVVALDPRNGEILVLVSKSSLDPNLFSKELNQQTYQKVLKQPGRPFFNRALAGQYPPGSTIKPLVALAGLQHGVTSPHYQMYAGPYFSISKGGRKFRDWKEAGHGWVNLQTSIAQSCDVFFYDLSYRIGIDRLQQTFGEFGLGLASGVDLFGEKLGIVPSREWKQTELGQPWYPEETLIAGIGQGYLLVTPLQLALVSSTLASRGIQMKPRLLKAVHNSITNEWQYSKQSVARTVNFNKSHWDLVIDSMVDVVHRPNGTAYKIGRDAPYVMAGKTGTAQVFKLGEERDYDEEKIAKKLKDHALFIGFAPAHNPVIAIAVIVEHVGSGSRFAAPIARRIFDAHFGVTKTASASIENMKNFQEIN